MTKRFLTVLLALCMATVLRAAPNDALEHREWKIDGVTRDFNVMTRRGHCRARVEVFRQGFAPGTGGHAVCLLAVSGAWQAQDAGLLLQAGEGALYGAAEPASTPSFEPAGDAVMCLCVTLETEPGQ